MLQLICVSELIDSSNQQIVYPDSELHLISQLTASSDMCPFLFDFFFTVHLKVTHFNAFDNGIKHIYKRNVEHE